MRDSRCIEAPKASAVPLGPLAQLVEFWAGLWPSRLTSAHAGLKAFFGKLPLPDRQELSADRELLGMFGLLISKQISWTFKLLWKSLKSQQLKSPVMVQDFGYLFTLSSRIYLFAVPGCGTIFFFSSLAELVCAKPQPCAGLSTRCQESHAIAVASGSTIAAIS